MTLLTLFSSVLAHIKLLNNVIKSGLQLVVQETRKSILVSRNNVMSKSTLKRKKYYLLQWKCYVSNIIAGASTGGKSIELLESSITSKLTRVMLTSIGM
jgi:hypothetical protein